MSSNHPKTLTGIETLKKERPIQVCFCSNHPKTLTGIETALQGIQQKHWRCAPITPKPLQGLKPISGLEINGPSLVGSNHPKTLTGIETIVREQFQQIQVAPITPKPLQGLKPREHQRRLHPLRSNHPKTLTGIETSNKKGRNTTRKRLQSPQNPYRD